MTLKRPVCATPVGGIPEIIEHGRTGLLSGAGDAAALAGNILRLAEEPAAMERLVLEASRFVAGYCDPEAHTRKVLEVFGRAVRQGWGGTGRRPGP
jgi:glycosyltransferase involved in cell wall biosynthesis